MATTTTYKGGVTIGGTCTVAKTTTDVGSKPVLATATVFREDVFDSGAGDLKHNMVIQRRERVIAALGSETIDLSGSEKDPHESAAVFTKVKVIVIENTGAVPIHVGGASTDIPMFAATNDKIVIPPGAVLGISIPKDENAYVVTATTHDTLTLTNPDDAVAAQYNLQVRGISA